MERAAAEAVTDTNSIHTSPLRRMRACRRAGAVLFFVLCLGWYGRVSIWRELPGLDGRPSDFLCYYNAAQDILAGQSPYATVGYIYPPLLACLSTPLALLDYVTARRVWFAFSQACLITAAFLVWHSFGRDWKAACSVAFVWATGGSAVECLGLGQLGPILTLLITLSYTQAGWLKGTSAGFGLALKFIPGLLGIGLLLRRDWRTLWAFATSATILLLLPWAFVECCLQGPKVPAGTDTWTGTPATLSWSLPSVVLRSLDPPKRGKPLPRNWDVGSDLPYLRLPPSHRLASIGVALATLLGGFTILTIAVRGRVTSLNQLPWVMAALVALGTAASPVGWTHYQVMQYPGVALLLSHAWRLRRWMLVASTLACAALLYPVPVAVLTDYYHKNGGWTAASPATLYFWTSVTPVASLALFGLLVREAKRLGRRKSHEEPKYSSLPKIQAV